MARQAGDSIAAMYAPDGELDVPGRAAPVTARGGFVALWRRDARGRWRLRSMRTY